MAYIEQGEFLDPFVIGVFCGKSKPSDLQAYLYDFIQELKQLNEDGIFITSCNKTVKVKVDCFICDAPARSFLKQCKGHNAYSGCERCVQHGQWNDKVIYPNVNAPLRSKSFALREDIDHHYPTPSPLLQLSLGLVSQFVLDPMHLVYLGVMRRILILWIRGPVKNKCRIGNKQVMLISN